MTGLLVAFEGPNGAGKSTLLDLTCKALEHKGHRVAMTKEPTDSWLGRLVRMQDGGSLDATAYFCLVLADRYDHGSELRNLLEQNEFVLCDRYTGSSLVLNGLRGVSTAFVEAAHAGALLPDFTFIVMATPERLYKRIQKRAQGVTPGEQLATRQEEYDAYNALSKDPSIILGRTIRISNDGDDPADAMQAIIQHLGGTP